jgi:hypothetical protein
MLVTVVNLRFVSRVNSLANPAFGKNKQNYALAVYLFEGIQLMVVPMGLDFHQLMMAAMQSILQHLLVPARLDMCQR